MKLLSLIRLGHKDRIAVPPFGGDVRPAVMGPTNIKGQLARLAFVRVFLLTIIVSVSLACLVLAIRTPMIMGTELFVGDGSAVGCHVQSYEVD